MSGSSEARPEAGLTFADAPEAERFEARLEDGDLAAIMTYRLGTGWIALLHTEVEPELAGRGIAGRFATWVFDEVRRRDLKVVPSCPFIVAWLPRHPEVHDLLLRDADRAAAEGAAADD